jgi:hypothetical protein
MNNNINDFLKLLDETNKNDVIKVYVPSLKQEVNCKPLTVPQQKEVIKAVLNGVKGNIMLPKVFNNIILENIQGDIIPSIIDKNSILVQMRQASLGTAIFNEKGEKTTLVYKFNDINVDLSTTIEDHGIKVTLEVPDIKKDNEYFNAIDTKTYENAGDVVNDLYIHEVAKFIAKIEFLGNTAIPNIRDSIQIVNKLPLSINDKILKYIKSVKDYDNAALIAEDGTQIELTAKFFNTTD